MNMARNDYSILDSDSDINDVIMLLHFPQLEILNTFDDVCPLLDGTVSYFQHVRVNTDLQLTTRNLPDTVRNSVVFH